MSLSEESETVVEKCPLTRNPQEFQQSSQNVPSSSGNAVINYIIIIINKNCISFFSNSSTIIIGHNLFF